MPDPHRVEGELIALLSKPQYINMLQHRNEFMNPGPQSHTPEGLAHARVLSHRGERSGPDIYSAESIAREAAQKIWRGHLLINPVEVIELHGPLELYRAHDGGASYRTLDGNVSRSAGTLGLSWFERRIVEAIWDGTKRYGAAQRELYMDFLRSANFVLQEWNKMRYIVCMKVPEGCSVVVVRGRGDWRAMRTPPGESRPDKAPPIRTAADVENHLGWLPLPGTSQCVVPLYNENWVRQLPPDWETPFYS